MALNWAPYRCTPTMEPNASPGNTLRDSAAITLTVWAVWAQD